MLFEALREKLLRAGVAPRHVRRYLTELNEHMADLIAIQHGAGYTGDDAVMRARATLGDDDDLARAMTSRRGVRSWSARAPWLIFTLLPPLSLLFFVLLWTIVLIIVGGTHGVLGKHGGGMPWPQWYVLLAQFMSGTGNLLWAPAIASLFAFLAWRQRLSLIWPLTATAILLLNVLHLGTQIRLLGQSGGFVLGARWIGHFNSLELAWTTLFSAGAWRLIVAEWPWMLGQWTLTILPLAYLLKISGAARAAD